MGEAFGAKIIDLEWVKVHTTGLVKPDDLDGKIKFFAVGRRDCVTGEMWKKKPPFHLTLNKAASDEIATGSASIPRDVE